MSRAVNLAWAAIHLFQPTSAFVSTCSVLAPLTILKSTMTDEDKKPGGFWNSLPGVLTGIAALITACVAAFGAYKAFHSDAKQPELPRQAEETRAPTPDPNRKSRVTARNLKFDFEDIILHPSPGRPEIYETSVSFRITNEGEEPIEIALNTAPGRPTLTVSGVRFEYKSDSGLYSVWPTTAQCTARTGPWQFSTIQPGEYIAETIQLNAAVPFSSLEGATKATLAGSLFCRPPKSGECIAVPIPGDGIRAVVRS